MHCFIIDPDRQVTRHSKTDGSLASIYSQIGASVFESVRLPLETETGRHVLTLYVDEEGHLKEGERYCFFIEGFPMPLVGKALVCSINSNGEMAPPNISIDVLCSKLTFAILR